MTHIQELCLFIWIQILKYSCCKPDEHWWRVISREGWFRRIKQIVSKQKNSIWYASFTMYCNHFIIPTLDFFTSFTGPIPLHAACLERKSGLKNVNMHQIDSFHLYCTSINASYVCMCVKHTVFTFHSSNCFSNMQRH